MEGTYIKYEDKAFKPETLDLIDKANSIILAYEKAGHVLTVRQLYYQLVVGNHIPNKQSSYNRLARVISDARLAGLVSWTAIEDRNRSLKGMNYHSSIEHLMSGVANAYTVDLWDTQEFRPEVWVEKASLEPSIANICRRLRVDYYAQRGYNSQSNQWEAGRRLAGYIRKGQRPIVFHLGDHDPSGLDMTEDNRSRLAMFAGVPIPIVRVALNIDQVHEYSLAPNPAKPTDSRYGEYQRKYGEHSWELDALSPDKIEDLVSAQLRPLINQELWDEAVQEEHIDKERIRAVIKDNFGNND